MAGCHGNPRGQDKATANPVRAYACEQVNHSRLDDLGGAALPGPVAVDPRMPFILFPEQGDDGPENPDDHDDGKTRRCNAVQARANLGADPTHEAHEPVQYLWPAGGVLGPCCGGILGALPSAVHEAELCPVLHRPESDAQLRGPDG